MEKEKRMPSVRWWSPFKPALSEKLLTVEWIVVMTYIVLKPTASAVGYSALTEKFFRK